MHIRPATTQDIPAAIELGRCLHATTRFAAFDYDSQRVAQALRGLIEIGQNGRGSHCLLVAEDKAGGLAGALAGCVEQHIFSAQPVASVMHFGVRPERRMSGAGLRLLTAFRRWAQNRGAFELSVGVNSGVQIEKMDRFLTRLGFVRTGGNYSMGLPPNASSHHPENKFTTNAPARQAIAGIKRNESSDCAPEKQNSLHRTAAFGTADRVRNGFDDGIK